MSSKSFCKQYLHEREHHGSSIHSHARPVDFSAKRLMVGHRKPDLQRICRIDNIHCRPGILSDNSECMIKYRDRAMLIRYIQHVPRLFCFPVLTHASLTCGAFLPGYMSSAESAYIMPMLVSPDNQVDGPPYNNASHQALTISRYLLSKS